MSKQNHYEVLGVPPDADDATIKKAYRKRASETHPDREGGSDEAAAAVNAAYSVLSNPARRKAFDGGKDDEAVVDQLTTLIMQHFIAVVSADYGGASNWVKQTRGRIAKEKDKVITNKLQLERQLRYLEKSSKNLVYKKAGRGLLTEVLEHRITKLKEALTTVVEDLKLVESAFKFLDDYDWTGEELHPMGQSRTGGMEDYLLHPDVFRKF